MEVRRCRTAMSEVGDQISDGRDQRSASEVRIQTADIRGRRSEVTRYSKTWQPSQSPICRLHGRGNPPKSQNLSGAAKQPFGQGRSASSARNVSSPV